jgi:Mg2+ and Co2+ transporter CorA
MTELPNDKIPLFKKWRQWYVFIILVLVLLIILFYFFTKHFS